MPGCAVKKCGNNSSKPAMCDGKPVTFHQFPADEQRKDLWAAAIREAGKGDSWTPNRNSKICSVHFLEHHIERSVSKNGKPRQMTLLTKDAVPSLFPHFEKTANQNTTKAFEKKSVLLPYSLPSEELVKEENILDKAMAGLDLLAANDTVDMIFNIVQSVDDEGNATHLLSLDAVGDIPSQLLSGDPVETKPPNETRKMVLMPSESGGGTIFFPPKAKPFVPSKAEEQAGPSKTEEEDDDACCGGHTDLDSDLCSTVKNGKAGDLAKEFRSGMEALQAVQTKFYHMVPPERLNKFGNLLELLSKEGRELLKESKVITDQISLFKRYEPPQDSRDDVKRLREGQQNVLQTNSTSQLQDALDQIDTENLLAMDEETWKAVLEGIVGQ